MRDAGLEELRKVFEDQRLWIGMGLILKTEMAKDRSAFRCRVRLLPEGREIVTEFAADAVGDKAGDWGLPSVNDLVLVGFPNGEEDYAYILKTLSTKQDQIPANAEPGNRVTKVLPGKKIWQQTDTRFNISRSDTEPTENMVLGQVLKTLLADLLTAQATQATAIKQLALDVKTMATDLASHTHLYLPGPGSAAPSSPPATAATYTAGAVNMQTAATAMESAKTTFDDKKGAPVNDGAMLSDLAFVQK